MLTLSLLSYERNTWVIKLSSGVRVTVREGGAGARAVIFSVWAAHTGISLFILIRMNQVCLPEDYAPMQAHAHTHTHTHYKSTEISIMLISVRGNRFQNIPSNYVCDSFISEGESCLCVCVYMQWQKEKWRVSVKKREEPERGVL